jgi:preprotein translocase subunit SecG
VWAKVLLGFFILDCVVLIIAVLLQPGKADAAALFGGGGSQTAFGPRGTTQFLGWVTIVAAVLFMGIGLIFTIPNTLGPSSVVREISEPAPTQQPQAPAPQEPPPAAQPAQPPAPQK